MKNDKAVPSRRRFLLAAGAGAAAAAAPLNPERMPPETARDVEARAGSGYRDSAHVRAYYRTART
jgi:hypothetical protein